jgi:hypothetical protein
MYMAVTIVWEKSQYIPEPQLMKNIIREFFDLSPSRLDGERGE